MNIDKLAGCIAELSRWVKICKDEDPDYYYPIPDAVAIHAAEFLVAMCKSGMSLPDIVEGGVNGEVTLSWSGQNGTRMMADIQADENGELDVMAFEFKNNQSIEVKGQSHEEVLRFVGDHEPAADRDRG